MLKRLILATVLSLIVAQVIMSAANAKTYLDYVGLSDEALLIDPTTEETRTVSLSNECPSCGLVTSVPTRFLIGSLNGKPEYLGIAAGIAYGVIHFSPDLAMWAALHQTIVGEWPASGSPTIVNSLSSFIDTGIRRVWTEGDNIKHSTLFYTFSGDITDQSPEGLIPRKRIYRQIGGIPLNCEWLGYTYKVEHDRLFWTNDTRVTFPCPLMRASLSSSS